MSRLKRKLIVNEGIAEPLSPERKFLLAKFLYPKCPVCKRKDPSDTLIGHEARIEFATSGMCQRCQDSILE